MPILESTKRAWGWGIIVLALILAITQLGLIKADVSSGLLNAGVLSIIGITIIFEKGGNPLKIEDASDAILMVVGISAFIFAAIAVVSAQIPPAFASVAVFLYGILAVSTAWSIYK